MSEQEEEMEAETVWAQSTPQYIGQCRPTPGTIDEERWRGNGGIPLSMVRELPCRSQEEGIECGLSG